MFDIEKSLREAQAVFDQLVEYTLHASQSENAYTVEKKLFKESLKINLHLLAAYFEAKEGGNIGKSLTINSGDVLARERLKDRRYLSVPCFYRDKFWRVEAQTVLLSYRWAWWSNPFGRGYQPSPKKLLLLSSRIGPTSSGKDGLR